MKKIARQKDFIFYTMLDAHAKFYYNLVGAFCERSRETAGLPYGVDGDFHPRDLDAHAKFYHNLVGAFCERPRTTKGRPYGVGGTWHPHIPLPFPVFS